MSRSSAHDGFVPSLNAQLAAALVVSERTQAVLGLESELLDEVVEHLWQWPTVVPDTFMDWHDWRNPLYMGLLGGEMPGDFVAAVRRVDADVEAVVGWLMALVEIVEAHLFAATRWDVADGCVDHVLRFGAAHGVTPPPWEVFRIFGSKSDGNDWGTKVEATDLAEWRGSLGVL